MSGSVSVRDPASLAGYEMIARGTGTDVKCLSCEASETYRDWNEARAGYAWHVFESHRATWDATMGDTVPDGPKPIPERLCAPRRRLLLVRPWRKPSPAR